MWIALGTLLLLAIASFVLWWFRVWPFNGAFAASGRADWDGFVYPTTGLSLPYSPSNYFSGQEHFTRMQPSRNSRVAVQPRRGSAIYFSKREDPNHNEATFSGMEKVEGVTYISTMTGMHWAYNRYYGRYVEKI